MWFRSLIAAWAGVLALTGCVTSAPEATPADQMAAALLDKSGGFTLDYYGKSLGESGLYAVSPYPERSLKLGRQPTGEDIANFREVNQDLLAKAHHDVGGWCEGKEHGPPCYLDVS